MDKSPNISPALSDDAPSNPALSRESSASTATITPMTESGPSSRFTSLPSAAASTSASSSAAQSPLASRDPSPTRPLSRTATSRTSSAHSGIRSRKNSQQDLSPSRPAKPAGSPAPAPGSRSLSSANTPTLLPSASDSTASNVTAPMKSPTAMEHLRESPRWPVSPRLRSPPPILHKPNIGLPRRPEPEPPLINLQRPTPPLPPAELQQSDTDGEDAHSAAGGVRTPARGGGGSTSTLETVQEVSPIGSPRGGPDESIGEKLDDSIISDASQGGDSVDPLGLARRPTNGGGGRTSANDSGSETDNLKAGRRSGAASAPPLTSRQSSACIKQGVTKSKTGDLSLQSMTVETETVTSIPQAPLVPGTGVQGSSVSLRTKGSTETIRPKREKKKPTRKQPPVTAGNASSKADIFEAKIASAVEEANSSDSEETFVYDSNPPDGRERPMRFHSRTPSATSMASQADRAGMRSIHAIMESTGPPMMVKKSMKFTNGNNSESALVDDDGRGTARSTAGSARGTARHHHHFGRWGRNGAGAGGNGHPSLFAEHSPFNASLASGNPNSRQSSGPPSPRFGTRAAAAGANGKRSAHLSMGYDLDDTTTGADDETTPLIQSGTVRSARSGRGRRGLHSLRSIEAQTYHRSPPSVLNRFASCLVLTVMLLLVVSGAIGFMFATSQPLTGIQLVSMDHVVASQQELMLDLTIRAHNPNVVVVVVDSADIEVFAKSPHAMTDSEWWRHTHPGEIGPPPPHKVDPDSEDNNIPLKTTEAEPDPDPNNPEDTAPNMRLGTITTFESALSFEGSFFHKGVSYSSGEVRLRNPGNGTYGGQERWERIMEDEFQLVLKGVLRYTLPLSQRVRTASISGKTTVRPNAANDPGLRPNGTLGDGGEEEAPQGRKGEVTIEMEVDFGEEE